MRILQGCVRDKTTGAPIPGASVALIEWMKAADRVLTLGAPRGERAPMDSGPRFVRLKETETDKAGTFVLSDLDAKQYRVEISAARFETRTIDIDQKPGEKVVQVDVQLNRLPVAELRGRVLVTNLDGCTMSGVRLEVIRNDKSFGSTTSDSSGNYAGLLLPDGNYSVSVVNYAEKLLESSSDWAAVIVSQTGDSIPPHDVPVQMQTIPIARLGLAKKKTVLYGGGPVSAGYCKIVRLKPDGAVERLVGAKSPDVSPSDGHGWFEFQDLLPGAYAVTLYKPGGKDFKELPKYSTTFTLGRKELRDCLKRPYFIGSSDGRNTLLVSWDGLDEVKDEIDTITAMIKDVTGIMTDLGIKILGSK